jgi:hypothetical protein
VLLRLLDHWAAPLSARRGGLLGNLVLQLHCPSHDVQHLMFGHFTVPLIFVVGLGSLHIFLRRR